jgi:hypothetical protein
VTDATMDAVPAPDPGKLLASAHAGLVTNDEGQSVPVRIARHDREMVLLVLEMPPGEHPDPDAVQRLVLECGSAYGVVKVRGEAELEPGHVVRFRALEALEVRQRRQFVRVQVTRPVIVAAGAENVHTSSVDLSGGGMLLAGPSGLDGGDEVEFRIDVQEGMPPIEGIGRVVRRTDDGHRAIAFDRISDEDRERLIHFVFEADRVARARGARPR